MRLHDLSSTNSIEMNIPRGLLFLAGIFFFFKINYSICANLKIFYIEVYVAEHNVRLVSGVQQSDSVTYIHISISDLVLRFL